ncbi:MAG: hypothetical protein IPK60_18370 [Sandaracinaceae bacterium]|jgi:hypothetical protein|nr:hypothetical protein [Sandaracinaceae bacterium]
MRIAISTCIVLSLAVGCSDPRRGAPNLDAGSFDAANFDAANFDAASIDAPTSPTDMNVGVDASRDLGLVVGGRSAAEVCSRWNADRANLSEGTWNGSVATCNPGDMDAAWRGRVMRQVNLYRWLSGLSDTLNHDAALDSRSQQAALMMTAQMGISHTPDSSWPCYTAEGADAAGHSNLAGGNASVASIASYMVDGGNATTLGHRRWILSNTVGPFGIGSTDLYSVLYVVNGASSGAAYAAWPSTGVMPIQAWTDSWGRSIDETGWSVQSNSIDLSGATAIVTTDGETLATTTTHLLPNYGSSFAISIMHTWEVEAGRVYHVSLTGVSSPIEYDVAPVNCAAL